MVKLWKIVTIFGKIAAVIGPLNYPIDRCLQEIAETTKAMEAEFDRTGGDPTLMFGNRMAKWDDIALSCELRNKPPAFNVTPQDLRWRSWTDHSNPDYDGLVFPGDVPDPAEAGTIPW